MTDHNESSCNWRSMTAPDGPPVDGTLILVRVRDKGGFDECIARYLRCNGRSAWRTRSGKIVYPLGWMPITGLTEKPARPAKPRVKIVCSECGGENVMSDAYAEWCVETQTWEVAQVFDKGAYCDDCDNSDVRLVKVELPDDQEEGADLRAYAARGEPK